MALVNCEECGNEVSESAELCQKCGHPTPFALAEREELKQQEDKGRRSNGCFFLLLGLCLSFVFILFFPVGLFVSLPMMLVGGWRSFFG